MKKYLFSIFFAVISVFAWGQTTLLTETFGTTTALPTGWASSNATNGWAGSTASPSTYSGASGGSNAVFNNTGTLNVTHTLTYNNSFSTVGYTNITVLWGARATSAFNGTIGFQWSTDGTTWNTVTFTDVARNQVWALVNGGTRITLPVGAEGASNLRFRFNGTTPNVTVAGNYRIDDFTVQGTSTSSPQEIDVKGNNTSIVSGDTTPSTTDDTDFGASNISSSISKTYTIYNTGNNSLSVSGVTITGTNASDFSVTASPSTTVSGGNNTTFIVKFLPTAAGTRTATINIANDDSNENPYTFSIQGTGTLDCASTALATSVEATQFQANWSAVTGATSYVIDLSTSPTFASPTYTNLASWSFPTNTSTDVNPDSGITGNLTKQFTSNKTIDYTFPGLATGCGYSTNWVSGSGINYWQVNFSTTGYANVRVSSIQKSSGTGPRDFQVQYKVGASGTWTNVGSAVTVGNDWTTGVVSNLVLPSACDDQADVYVRWLMASNTNVNNATVASGGTTRIDNIVIEGNQYSYVSPTPNYNVGNTTNYTFTSLTPNTTYYYRVRAVNSGIQSTSCNVTTTCTASTAYSVSGGGAFCNGGTITLPNSETGVSYQLYKDGTASGALVSGTGNLISFGNQTAGTYTVKATNTTSCAIVTDMTGSQIITAKIRPTAVVSGTTSICSGSTTISVALTGTGPWNLTWSDGFTSTTQTGITTSPYTFSVSPTSTTTYTVTALSDTVCSAQSGDITGGAIVTNTTPSSAVTITTTPSNGTICNGDIAKLEAAASVQNGTTSVGTNNNVGSKFSETPYRIGGTNPTRIQYLITKAELNAYGINGPTTINSLGFNVIDKGFGSVTNYGISMGNTNLSTLPALDGTTSLTPVYNSGGTTPYMLDLGINYHDFSTPFVWDGTSNLLINICHDAMNGGNNHAKVVVCTPTQASTMSKTAAGACNSINSGDAGTNRPVFYFKYTQQPAITWSPTTDLYTDAGASIAYTGANAATVYAKPSANATYTASASLGGSCAITNTATINVNPTTAITTQPTGATYCKDATATSLNVVATGTGTLTYQWYSNTSSSVTGSTLLTGETNSSYTPLTSTAGTTYYYVIVSGSCGTPVTSNIVSVTVDPTSVAGTVSAGSSSVCSGTGTTLTLNGYTGNIQWQSSSDNITFSNIPGETSATYNTANLTSTTHYRAVVTSGSCTSATTSSIAVTVDEPITFANLQWPSSGQICDNSTFTAYGQVYKNGVTPGAGAGAGITVEFGYNTSNTNPNTWTNWSSATYNSDSGNNDEYKYTFTPPTSGTYYYTFRYKVGNCDWVYGGYNSGFWNGTSNVNGVLTVDPTAVAGTVNAGSGSVCSGTGTTLTLTGYTGNIQWQSSTNNVTFNNIPGETSASYNTGNLTSTTYYRAVVSSGSCTSTTSTSIMISVDQPITYANLQWWEDTPGNKPTSIVSGNSITAYGQVYKAGVTNTGSPGAGITVEFGYSTVDATSVADFATANWTWTAAQFNSDYFNNDEYKYVFTPAAPGTYYFTFRYKTGNCDWVYGGYNGGFWNGSSNVSGVLTVIPGVAIWQSGAWLYGVTPSASIDTIIRDNYNAGSNGDFTAKTLTIDANNTVDIPSGHAVTVVGALTNNGNLTVESGANLLQTNDSAVNSGSIKVMRNFIYSSGRGEYNFVISPTVNFNLKYMYPEITAPTSSNPYTLYYNEATKYFGNSAGTYIPGRGLAVKEPSTAYVSASSSDASYTGVPFNGTLSYNLQFTDAAHGYNLVGNPYPSNLDIKKVYDANTSAISSTFYFWDRTTNSVTVQQGSSYSSNSYGLYNALSDTSTPAQYSGGGNSSKSPNNVVSVAQGFIVQALGTGKSISYDNSMRTSTTYGATFFGKTANTYDRYWLSLTTPSNLVNTLAVIYFDKGNNNFGQDDSKLMSLSSDAVYSLAGTEKVAINGRSTFDASDIVEVGTNQYINGDYTFSLANKEGIFASGQNVYLKDLLTGSVTNLSEGSYTFNASAGEITGRFEIIYQPSSTLAVSNASATDLQVYRNGDSFVVASSGQKITGIEVFDFSGRLVKTIKSNDSKVVVDAKFMVGGNYVVKVNRNGNITTRKVLK